MKPSDHLHKVYAFFRQRAAAALNAIDPSFTNRIEALEKAILKQQEFARLQQQEIELRANVAQLALLRGDVANLREDVALAFREMGFSFDKISMRVPAEQQEPTLIVEEKR